MGLIIAHYWAGKQVVQTQLEIVVLLNSLRLESLIRDNLHPSLWHCGGEETVLKLDEA